MSDSISPGRAAIIVWFCCIRNGLSDFLSPGRRRLKNILIFRQFGRCPEQKTGSSGTSRTPWVLSHMRLFTRGSIVGATVLSVSCTNCRLADGLSLLEMEKEQDTTSFVRGRVVMRNTYACLLSVGWFTVPAPVSANAWSKFGARWSDRDRVTQGCFEQDSLIQTVADTRLVAMTASAGTNVLEAQARPRRAGRKPKPIVVGLMSQGALVTPLSHSATFAIIHPTVCIASLIAPTHGWDGVWRVIR